ncbi:hypothetical protein RRG08_015671 [Elysia crispata]|uniref:Corticotropin-releasing factor domain-containing protein n=1 Tax=Elysia crispata TaxID=231223 RepID=A0AAE0Y1J5_9GAST|nr:hypothetical protein RRG08_015671 [Elysia crispata]
MEISCLIKASFLSSVVLVAFLNVCVTSTPVYTRQTASSTHDRSTALKKCADSLKLDQSDRRQQNTKNGEPGSIDAATSLASDSKECKDLLDNVITSSGIEGKQKVVSPPSSASSSPGFNNPKHTESGKINLADELTGSSEDKNLLDQGSSSIEQPLSRRSRDIGSTDREMLLRARGIVSRVMEDMGAADATGDDENSQEIPDEALFMALAKQRLLAELRNTMLRKAGPAKNGQLVRLLNQDPSLALEHVAASKLNQGVEENDLDSEEDSFYSRSHASAQNPDFSSESRAKDNEQTSWVRPAGSENDVMGAPAGKRYSRSRFVQKRNPNTLSINNAMMAISNMVLAQQKERLQRNRQRIRQHMLIQG